MTHDPLYVWSGRKTRVNNRRSFLVHYVHEITWATSGKRVVEARCGAVLNTHQNLAWSNNDKDRAIPSPHHICPACKQKGRRDRV